MFFKDVVLSDKQLTLDVQLRRDPFLRQTHLLKTLELLSTVHPEIKKIKKLVDIIMDQTTEDFIPCEIKIPVISTLGIKAIVQID